MSLITETQLLDRARAEIRKSGGFTLGAEQKSRVILNETRTFNKVGGTNYDIFLSHSSNDAEEVAGLKLIIEDAGYKVYVDWIDDPLLDRRYVTKATAKKLQERMAQSNSLIYAFSEHSGESKWMPWELGYFDGIKGLVAVLPIAKSHKDSFQGTEYLGLYPYVEMTGSLYVHESVSSYMGFEAWIKKTRKF